MLTNTKNYRSNVQNLMNGKENLCNLHYKTILKKMARKN